MSRAIHCLGRRAITLLRPCPALTTRAPYSIIDRHMNCITTSRNIFTANAVGIGKLDHLRTQKEQMFAGEARERYIERLRNFVESGDCQSIYKDDLVNMLGIAESEQDLDLLEMILEKSNEEQRNFFGGWGTTIMRLYYKMNALDRAVKNLEDTQRFGDFFNMRSCYKIAMTMLYDRGQYQKIVDLFNLSSERLKDTPAATAFAERTGAVLLPDRDLVLLAFSAYAKLNTPESLQASKTMLNKFNESGKNIGLRPASFVAYLCVENGDYKYALNMISSLPSRNYVSLRDIKMLALIKVERFDDVLRSVREYAASTKLTPNQLLKSTYEKLQGCKGKIQDVATRQELDDLLVEIADGSFVSESTLVDLIFRPVDYEREPMKRRDDSDRLGQGRSGVGPGFLVKNNTVWK